MSKMQRTKGKVWEREVARELREVFGPGVKRGWQSRSGQESCDVDGSPFWTECKHHQLVNIPAAMRQAENDTDGRPPLVVSKSNRCEPMATMLWHDFLTLLRKAYEEEENGSRALLQQTQRV